MRLLVKKKYVNLQLKVYVMLPLILLPINLMVDEPATSDVLAFLEANATKIS